MRIVSFNVNGLRGFTKKLSISFNDFLNGTLKADIACIQEIKGTRASLEQFFTLKDYFTKGSFHVKRGRHGVATFYRKGIWCGGSSELISGRILRTVHDGFVLDNCYLPYDDVESTDDKTSIVQIYDKYYELINLNELLITCGDYNACYNMIDHYQYAAELKKINKNKAMFDCEQLTEQINEAALTKLIERTGRSKRELPYVFKSADQLKKYFYDIYQRRWLYKFSNEFTDTFRIYNKNLEEYTCWNTVLRNRPDNLGTRIDYIFCSKNIKCTHSGAMQFIDGSDHCPVFADFDLKINEKPNAEIKKNNILEYIVKKTKL